jgi:hypothetical protein
LPPNGIGTTPQNGIDSIEGDLTEPNQVVGCFVPLSRKQKYLDNYQEAK